MKKALNVLIMTIVIFPTIALASGNITVSPTSITVEVGSTKTISITATNTIGDVTITSSDKNIAKVNISEWETGMIEEGQTKKGSVKVTGVSEGTTTITFTIDASTFDSEDLSGQKRIVTIKVVPKTTTTTKKTTTTTTTKEAEINLDDNNSLKTLCASNYNCFKLNDTTYELVVPEDIDTIDIVATPKSKNANINGLGTKKLIDDISTFTITVTSESGQPKEYILKVKREQKKETIETQEINYYQIIALVEFIFIIAQLIYIISFKRKMR